MAVSYFIITPKSSSYIKYTNVLGVNFDIVKIHTDRHNSPILIIIKIIIIIIIINLARGRTVIQ